MLEPLKPTPEQTGAINAMCGELWATGGALNGSDMGTGKTLMLTEVALNLKAQTVLISAPLHTRYGWSDTVGRQTDYAVPFHWINNNTKAGKAALESLKHGDAGFYFIGRELFRLIDWRGVRIDMVVHDEALALTTPILTTAGWSTIGDLRVGDRVYGTDGKPTEVTHLFPVRHDKKVYELELDTGERIVADAGHKWVAAPKVHGGSQFLKPRTVTTEEMAARGTTWRIPIAAPLTGGDSLLPTDPYLLGQWLGNGCAGQPYLTVRDELVPSLIATGAERGYEVSTMNSGKSATTTRVKLGDRWWLEARALGLDKAKSVPDAYLHASTEDRWALLRGLMDTDGYASDRFPSAIFTNTNTALLEAVVHLGRSLGFRVNTVPLKANDFTQNDCIRVMLSGGPESPFLLRDTDRHRASRKPMAHRIIAIREVESVPVRCIEVAAEDHQFLVGRSLIPTHNCQTIANRNNKGYKVAFDLRQRTRFTICQSATWYGANFENAWGIGRILYPDLVERNVYRWILKYCKTVRDPFSPTQTKVIGERTHGAFVESLPCYVNLVNTATMPPMVEDIYVDLSPRQRRLYDEFEEKGVIWLKEHPLVADVPVVQRIRLRQLSLAECDVTDEGKVIFQPNAKSSKFDALKDMLATFPEGEKVLITTDSAKFARMVAARLGSDAFAWTGDATQKERDRAKGRFMTGDLKYIVAVQKAISEGTDGLQQACHILVVLSDDDSVVQNQQMLGRLNRTGQKERVLVYRILARNTIDDPQAATLLGKAVEMRGSMQKQDAA